MPTWHVAHELISRTNPTPCTHALLYPLYACMLMPTWRHAHKPPHYQPPLPPPSPWSTLREKQEIFSFHFSINYSTLSYNLCHVGTLTPCLPHFMRHERHTVGDCFSKWPKFEGGNQIQGYAWSRNSLKLPISWVRFLHLNFGVSVWDI